jgi:uncharacterized protein YndB with AHSA1/START domain
MSDRGLRIERTFAAPAEDVFDAWTEPEVMRRWFHCGPDWSTPEAEVDLRIGGTIRIVMRRPDGYESSAYGEFVEIDRPSRLTMIWTFGIDPANQQLLELTFTEVAGETTVVLLNSRISTEERRESQEIGWAGCLDELARLLAANGDTSHHGTVGKP